MHLGRGASSVMWLHTLERSVSQLLNGPQHGAR